MEFRIKIIIDFLYKLLDNFYTAFHCTLIEWFTNNLSALIKLVMTNKIRAFLPDSPNRL